MMALRLVGINFCIFRANHFTLLEVEYSFIFTFGIPHNYYHPHSSEYNPFLPIILLYWLLIAKALLDRLGKHIHVFSQ